MLCFFILPYIHYFMSVIMDCGFCSFETGSLAVWNLLCGPVWSQIREILLPLPLEGLDQWCVPPCLTDYSCVFFLIFLFLKLKYKYIIFSFLFFPLTLPMHPPQFTQIYGLYFLNCCYICYLSTHTHLDQGWPLVIL